MFELLDGKVKSFLPEAEIEESALKQIKNMAEMPFIKPHIAIMPDCHCGIGATVGSVIATHNAIMPAAVGVDIGCGMIAVKTKFFAKDLPDNLKALREGIERRIPCGVRGHNSFNNLAPSERLHRIINHVSFLDASLQQTERAMSQLGSLGSGNHFIEISLDETQQVWVVLHSGSRGIGNELGSKHIKTAKALMERYFINLPDPDLAYYVEDTEEFNTYIRHMLWAQEYALENRAEMMDRVLTELSYTLCGENGHQKEIELQRINCHHNFTQKERHMGRDVWITRKGAIQMKQGQLGVIPGSMGTRSYIVEGKGNIPSFHSAPHGAGRKMSRTAARKAFTMEDFEAQLQGVECRKSVSLLDEIPGAYKDIDQVMLYAQDLVTVRHELKQVLNVKGD